MGRIRTIKPEFPLSESMGRISRDARLLFILLWTIADDSGRARAASRMLASLLFPYDDDAPDKVEDWLVELELVHCINRYDIDENSYLQITKWQEHQKVDKPSASRLPAYSREFAKVREASAPLPRTLDLGPRTKKISRASHAHPKMEDFGDWPTDYAHQFWQQYPRKVGKKAVLAALDRVRKRNEVSFADLMAALLRYASKTDDRPFCHPITWINQGRWTDEPASNTHGRVQKSSPLMDAARRLAERAQLDLEADQRCGDEAGGFIDGTVSER